ncbi:MAG: FkbM family methyltransferase [Richelia sp. RM2_1_2]|nr:FkbM family methyltransferase [Richelia sp. RM1_1_1]NJO62182.1 FkbM family methyltransferase [Richelia sp. RM2_1_2]
MTYIKKIALLANSIYVSAYSYYKVSESGLGSSIKLDADEREFFLKLRPLLEGENLVIYDIGAARGIVSSCLAKLPNVSSIHAFEPLPDFFEQLKIRMKHFNKVNCHHVALGNEEGIFPMYVNNWVTNSSFLPTSNYFKKQISDIDKINHTIDIQMSCLDNYVEKNQLPIPNLIKIDVQGFEKKVIEGGINTVRNSKYCFIEMSFQTLYENSALFDEIYRFMCDLGFRLIGVSNPMISKYGVPLQVDGIFENLEVNAK